MPPISLVSVIVPAYNEVERIAATLAGVRAFFERKPYDYEIIVVAEGDDGTRELARRFAEQHGRTTLIGDSARRGKGYGIRRGVGLARGDVIGFVDADNKTPIDAFDQFEAKLMAGYDVVIGSRALPDSVVERPQPWYRRVGSRVFAVVMHAIVGLKEFPDTQCGFKFFRRDAAREIFGAQRIDGYMFDVEILYLATRCQYRIAQVPVRWCDDGDSRLWLVRGSIRNGVDLLRIHRIQRRSSSVRPTGRVRETGAAHTAQLDGVRVETLPSGPQPAESPSKRS